MCLIISNTEADKLQESYTCLAVDRGKARVNLDFKKKCLFVIDLIFNKRQITFDLFGKNWYLIKDLLVFKTLRLILKYTQVQKVVSKFWAFFSGG